jgi:hypothetical protein
MTKCWKSRRDYLEEIQGHDVEDDVEDGTCVLPDGHAGEHDFLPDDVVRAKLAEPLPEEPLPRVTVIPEEFLRFTPEQMVACSALFMMGACVGQCVHVGVPEQEIRACFERAIEAAKQGRAPTFLGRA